LNEVPEITIESARRRPVLVVIIFWCHALAVFAFAWICFRVITGHFRLLRRSMVFYSAAAVVLITVKMWGALALYRLRRSAVSIFLSAVLLNLPLTIYDVYRHPYGYRLSSAISMLSGIVITIGVCLYAVHLAHDGTLNGDRDVAQDDVRIVTESNTGGTGHGLDTNDSLS
jgi:hypothetical protein